MSAFATSGSVDSHSTINCCVRSKSSSSTMTLLLACGRDMKATCCRWPSLWTSALIPASRRRSFRRLALAASLNVAMVTMFCRTWAEPFQIKHQLPAERKAGRGIPFVKHEVNENAGYRNVKPDRHGPPGDALMLVPTTSQRWDQSDDDQRQ